MKKIITFAVVLGILTGGIVFYTMRMQERAVQENVVKSLSKEIQLVHSAWKDSLVPDAEEGRVYRKANKDMATIVELTDSIITIDWDGWGVETFEKDAEGNWKLKK